MTGSKFILVSLLRRLPLENLGLHCRLNKVRLQPEMSLSTQDRGPT